MTASGALAGLRVAVTRPSARADGLVRPLEAAGAATRCFPLIRVVPPSDDAPLRAALASLASFDRVVFTSASAVEAVRVRLTPADAGPGGVAVVGPATSAAAVAAGWAVELEAEERVADGLADMLEAVGVGGQRILWPRAAGARPVLAERLRAAGATVVDPVAYDTRPDEAQARALAGALAEGRLDVVTFTSPSAVRSFVGARGTVPTGVRVAAIGPVTAAAAERAGLVVHIVPGAASADALVAALIAAPGQPS